MQKNKNYYLLISYILLTLFVSGCGGGGETPSDTTLPDLTISDKTAPIITLAGEKIVELAQGENYEDDNATATDNQDETVNVEVTGTVDTSVVGSYTITYTATDAAGNTAIATRTINVNTPNLPDVTAPVITLAGNNLVELIQGTTYQEAGATATDNKDGTVNVMATGAVDISLVGSYTITYTATDTAGNVATATRAINVNAPLPDVTAPVITLAGNNLVEVIQGTTYEDAGATATDNKDGTVNVMVTGTVDTSVVGSYTITYTATDAAGNAATASRAINVNVPQPDVTAPVITLAGNNLVEVIQGTSYQDAGATATDNKDGMVNVEATGAVDTSVVGSYTIIYTATDAAGNTATATRDINVNAPLPANVKLSSIYYVNIDTSGSEPSLNWAGANAVSYRILLMRGNQRPIEISTTSSEYTFIDASQLQGISTLLIEAFDSLGNSVFSSPVNVENL